MPRSTFLEFVTALAHDPEVAAAYAADPARALRDADLHDVSASDISALIPMAGGTDAGGLAAVDDNVWRGSEALFAFDAVGGQDTPIPSVPFPEPGMDHETPPAPCAQHAPYDGAAFNCAEDEYDLGSDLDLTPTGASDPYLTALMTTPDAVPEHPVPEHPVAEWSVPDPVDHSIDPL
ncbi:hypothetical protein GTV32_03860 [Gordonia sp. SID5947]|uniref:IniB N-terminal domain-containing protein n=1 Tax=Gordonia sp. SID5947 TaxID=2690315 RepID=UPI001368E7F0|nr:hypothetical protein [Gordonia sp. SID5947]